VYIYIYKHVYIQITYLSRNKKRVNERRRRRHYTVEKMYRKTRPDYCMYIHRAASYAILLYKRKKKKPRRRNIFILVDKRAVLHEVHISFRLDNRSPLVYLLCTVRARACKNVQHFERSSPTLRLFRTPYGFGP